MHKSNYALADPINRMMSIANGVQIDSFNINYSSIESFNVYNINTFFI